MFRHKTQNRENQKSAIKTSSAVAECVPYAVPERQENNHSTKIYKFSADRLPQHLMNTASVFIVLICLFVLTLRIVGLSCHCFHSPTACRHRNTEIVFATFFQSLKRVSQDRQELEPNFNYFVLTTGLSMIVRVSVVLNRTVEC